MIVKAKVAIHSPDGIFMPGQLYDGPDCAELVDRGFAELAEPGEAIPLIEFTPPAVPTETVSGDEEKFEPPTVGDPDLFRKGTPA